MQSEVVHIRPLELKIDSYYQRLVFLGKINCNIIGEKNVKCKRAMHVLFVVISTRSKVHFYYFKVIFFSGNGSAK